MKIFLSYSSRNRAAVEPVHAALAAQGHEVFFDRSDLPAGVEYDQRIKEAVEGCELFAFMLSPDSVRPGSYALTELGLAQKAWPNPSGRVLPVVLVTVPLESMPPYLRSVTLLEPAGNLPAEVVDAVDRLRAARAGKWRKLGLAGGVVALLLAGAAVLTLKRGPDGAAMVRLPAGTFTVGDGEEAPQRSVQLDAFSIDRTEVTVKQYAAFLAATGSRTAPEGWDPAQGDLPVVGVDWRDAQAYCQWAGKRLPTEAEWERAARGSDSRSFPWGNEAPTAARARFAISAPGPYGGGLAPVGSHAAGQSAEGVQDLAGNAAEWVADWYAEGFAAGDVNNPKGPESGPGKVIRGGAWEEPAERLRSTKRFHAAPETRADDLGFRCAR